MSSDSSDRRLIEGGVIARGLAGFRTPNTGDAVRELMITVVPFAVIWALMLIALRAGFWECLVLILPEAGLLLRLFVIQHDCGHRSFFPNQAANDWTGRRLGVLTLTPYDSWRRDHAIHHASPGQLEQRGIGDIATLTVAEYQASTLLQRSLYRLYRHPAIMFGIGPAYLFVLRQRLPMGLARSDLPTWLSVLMTNAAIAGAAAFMIWVTGAWTFLLIQGPVTLTAAAGGVWLFYAQHQFEGTSWEHKADWRFNEAALHGSSYYDLPSVLRWFTLNIGVHHLHHISSRIPSYRIPEALQSYPELKHLGRLTISTSFKAARLSLWDEEQRRLVSFKEASRAGPPYRWPSLAVSESSSNLIRPCSLPL